MDFQDHVKKTLLVLVMGVPMPYCQHRQVGTPGYVTKGGPGGAQMGAGDQIERMFHILLDPQGQTQTELLPRRDVPDTQVEVFVSVQGDILAETILGSLTPTEVQQLLRVPSGCPEQTLSKLAPVVLLMGYLDTTGQCCSGTRLHPTTPKETPRRARVSPDGSTPQTPRHSFRVPKAGPSPWETFTQIRLYPRPCGHSPLYPGP
ncbi:hypothetical protein GHT09_004038 [Marmota monax]|uniref:Alpha-macroglobulin-like TED domain-containing protein n=1 Tax=Marmota monax TaxID=9995 RepID=A0A834UNJ2_MARMO|nr:hypothetical protein GHT09_004038 [Marmota monax]